jgi:uncharacterized membrane protein YhhN
LINGWLWLTLALITLNWLSVWFEWRIPNLISKPGVIITLLVWFTSISGSRMPAVLFGIGLAFSLAGDLLLMMPDSFFLFGAAAFILAHGAYIAGFNQPLPQISMPLITVAVIFFSLLIIVYAVIWRGLKSSMAFRKVNALLSVYGGVIGLMVLSAISTVLRPDWQTGASGLAVSGALLFLFSDILLVVDRFNEPMPSARLWKRMSYQLGQLALAAAVLLNFSQ